GESSRIEADATGVAECCHRCRLHKKSNPAGVGRERRLWQNGLGGVQRLKSTLGGNTVVGIVPGGIGDAFGQLFGFGYSTYSFGFNLQIPLSNKAERADHDRAVGAKQMATSQIDATAQQIALEVRNAMNQVEMNRAHIESSQKARDFAQQT